MPILRNVLLALARRPLVKRLVLSFPPTRQMVARFVPGETVDDVVAAVVELKGRGLLASIDVLGEDTRDRAGADAMTVAYVDLLHRLSREGLAGTAEVSVKLSALGLLLDDGRALATGNARTICAAARTVGTTVTLDMEDHTLVDETLAVLADLRREFPETGCVLQAYLVRTADDAAAQAAIPGARVRLCKGAYQEPAGVAYQDRADVDLSYVRCLRALMDGDGYPMVASHDPRLVEIAAELAQRAGRGVDDFEYQMLYGIRSDEQQRLADLGHRVRVYVPYGTDWYGYYMRRLTERPANVVFFLRSFLTRS